MKPSTALKIVPPATPVERGDLINAEEINQKFFRGRATTRWVRTRMRKLGVESHWLGGVKHWYEGQVRAAVES